MPNASDATLASPSPPEVGTTVTLSLHDLDPNPFQPRGAMDEAALRELVDSIRAQGLLQPITVRRVGERYQVVAGHRRLEAFRRLRAEGGDDPKYARIPALWRQQVDDGAMAVFGLIENVQRADLSPLEAAQALAAMVEREQLSAAQLAQKTGVDVDRVKRLLRLSRAPKVVQDACGTGVLVPELGHNGEPRLTASGHPKQERRRLDMMGALEFAKLHTEVAKNAPGMPKKADARVAKAIERALAERWTLRRIQSHCRAIVEGRPEREPMPAAAGAAPAEQYRPALFTDGDELRVRRKQLATASPEERLALCEVLRTLVRELGQLDASDGRGSAALGVEAPAE